MAENATYQVYYVVPWVTRLQVGLVQLKILPDGAKSIAGDLLTVRQDHMEAPGNKNIRFSV